MMARTFSEVAAELDKALAEAQAAYASLQKAEAEVQRTGEAFKSAKVTAMTLRKEMDSLLNSAIGGETKPKIG